MPLHDVVSNCYKVSTFGWVYENVLQPMSGPSEWPKTNKIKLLPPKFVRQPGRPKKTRRRDITEVRQSKGKDILVRWNLHTCKYCGIQGHNVRTCAKKKADIEGETSQRPATKKKATNNTHAEANNEQTPSQNPATGDAEVIDPEQLAHEEYLHDLYDWMNDLVNSIVPGVTVHVPIQPRTPSKPAQGNPQMQPPQSPVGPRLAVEMPLRPRKGIKKGNPGSSAGVSCSQPVQKTEAILNKLKKSKQKSFSQSG